LPKANSTPLFVPDSLVAFDGTSFRAVKDTVGNYSVTLPFSAANQFSLYEHLALGLGRDTLILPQGHTVTATSPVGHQLKVDSSSAPSVSQYPNMGNFTKGFAFTWPGRSLNDSLIIEFRKTHAKQKLYRIDALKETAVAPLHEDSLKSTLALALADSNKTFFLARDLADTLELAIGPSIPHLGEGTKYFRIGSLRLSWPVGTSWGRLTLFALSGAKFYQQEFTRAPENISLPLVTTNQACLVKWSTQVKRHPDPSAKTQSMHYVVISPSP